MPTFPYRPREPIRSVLHGCVRLHWPAVRELCEAHGKPLPHFVHREFEGYLRCGRPEYGFARIHCTACGHGG